MSSLRMNGLKKILTDWQRPQSALRSGQIRLKRQNTGHLIQGLSLIGDMLGIKQQK